MKLSIVIGTRPQLIKISPLVRAVGKEQGIELQFIDSGQHYDHELNAVFYEELGLPESTFLDVGSGPPGEQTGKALIAIEKKLKEFNPHIVLVIGDTNSTLAGALAAVKQKIPLGHIEAGLRSFDRNMPEEINRIIADHISDYLFAPTENAVRNLQKEGIPPNKVFFTYDITVDACLENHALAKEKSIIMNELGLEEKNFVLLTAHRQENVDSKENLCKLVSAASKIDSKVVFPVHPRTRKNLEKFGLLREMEGNCTLTKPLGYFDFLMLLGNAACVVTDSGGVQKEALILKTPCVTIRTTTEWMETIKLGANVLVGLDGKRIIEEVEKRGTKEFRASIKNVENPYGDGKTSKSILDRIKRLCDKD